MAAPDVLDTRVVNALFSQAALRLGAMPRIVSWLTELLRQLMGGLWVGGNAVLTRTELMFSPNGLNSALHNEPENLHHRIPLDVITSVQVRWGFVTNIIDIKTQTATWSLRCFGASQFAANIEIARSSV